MSSSPSFQNGQPHSLTVFSRISDWMIQARNWQSQFDEFLLPEKHTFEGKVKQMVGRLPYCGCVTNYSIQDPTNFFVSVKAMLQGVDGIGEGIMKDIKTVFAATFGTTKKSAVCFTNVPNGIEIRYAVVENEEYQATLFVLCEFNNQAAQ